MTGEEHYQASIAKQFPRKYRYRSLRMQVKSRGVDIHLPLWGVPNVCPCGAVGLIINIYENRLFVQTGFWQREISYRLKYQIWKVIMK